MQPMKLRSQLALFFLSASTLMGACAAAATWLLLQDEIASDQALPLAVLLVAIGFVFSLSISRRVTGRFEPVAEAVDAAAKALVSGAETKPPAALRIREFAQACERLNHAANVVRAREFGLRAADRAKDEFLATLGHELRNPLAAQAAAAHVLRKAAAERPAIAHAATVIGRQVQHMSRLIEDLLDVSRVIRGKVRLSRQPLDLAAAIQKAVSELRASGRLDHHAVNLELSEAWVHGDEARVQQIVANLVGNAVKYTPPGGKIDVTLRRDPDQAVLRVRDSGIGMSQELTGRVFDLFVQGEGESGRGLGIGLTLVKHLAELHGGKAFAASSGAGQGSVFTVCLPAIEARAQPPLAAAIPEEFNRHRIVLVEDNADTRDMMFAALQMDGHRVYEAVDVRSGIQRISTLKPDVALVDIGLPGSTGYELAAAVRESPERQSMVLIAMTGREQPDTLRRAREAGFDDYVTKPIAPDRLVRLIEAALAAKHRRAAARPMDARPH